ncbi:MAG: hypothetical protein WCK03_01635 [Candidatus Taylorbacteria bacterium]
MKPSLATLALLVSLTLASSSAHAATTVAGCPTGYTCVRTVQTTAPVCPTGYVCTLKSSTTGTQNTANTGTTASTYVPGSYTNLILRPQEQTLTPAQIQAAAQAQGLTLTVAQAQALIRSQTVASSSTTSSGQQMTAASQAGNTSLATTTATTSYIVSSNTGRVSTGTPDPFVAQGTYGSYAAAVNGLTIINPIFGVATSPGQSLTPRCASNQYWDSYGSGGSGCYNQQFTSPSFNSLIPNTTVTQIVSDPYCPSVRVNQYGVFSDRKNYACVMGEASRVSSYTNPFMTIANIFGVVYSPDISYLGYKGNAADKPVRSSNLCLSAVSLEKAKQMDTASSTPGNYFRTSRLLVLGSLGLDRLEQSLLYMENQHKGYWWNGKLAYATTGMTPNDGSVSGNLPTATDYPYSTSDWNDPRFQSLVQNIQFDRNFGIQNSMVSICLDANYKSNFPLWASHFSSLMLSNKAKGLWPTQ